MPLRLVVIDGADEGRFFPLSEGTVMVGNSRKNCDICLHDLLMSRVHCEIIVAGDRVVVRDMENSTGTLVNSQKVQEKELQLGDVVRVGNSYLRLQQEEAEPAAAAAAQAPAAAHEPGKLPHLSFDRLEELVDHQMAHFRLDGVLGRGRCGVVFRAHDLKDDRTVALKVLDPAFPRDEDEMQRFVVVLKAVMPLRHINLVNVWGAGKAKPYCWIAEQFVDGESLTQLLQRTLPDRKIDWRRGFRVAVHVARALDYIHQHHHAHGNVTPQNILVQASDRLTKLGDLMMSRALDGSTVLLNCLEDKLLAELPYLAPEQMQGDVFVDHLSDIYSLGTITYQLLTGRPPFGGETVEEILERIQDEAPPVKPRKQQKAVPESLERVVLRMLAKHQEDRYQTAGELLEDLERIAVDEEVEI